MKEAIVLYPSPPIGHLRAMVELGKLLLTHQPSLSIHILMATPPYQADSISTAPYIASVSSTVPSIVFHKLPEVSLPPSTTPITHHETLTFEILRLNNPNVLQALLSISNDYKIHAFIMDFFCTAAFTVSSHLNIPPYFFYASCVASLCSFLYLPTLHKNTTKSFDQLNELVEIPGVPPVPSADMPEPVLYRDDVYEIFLNNSTLFSKSAGIIVNSIESLESRPTKAIRDGLCVPDGPTPPIYCIGPLIVDAGRRNGGNTDNGVSDCLTWLDKQPSKSVVFICFGSLGSFSAPQLKEIAVGLERSGQRFLWVVRNPPSENLSVAIKEQGEPDLNALLPMGFLERTSERGKVVKSWAPQVAVLNHDSIGGFVTHCGWNSVLESICAGVPLVAWPLYAEQRYNRVSMVEEMKIALPMEESESGFVDSSEVEKRVRELMESEQGDMVRERTIAMKDAALAALSEGGSSRLALAQLFESWKKE